MSCFPICHCGIWPFKTGSLPFLLLITFLFILCRGEWVWTCGVFPCHRAHVEARGTLVAVRSLLSHVGARDQTVVTMFGGKHPHPLCPLSLSLFLSLSLPPSLPLSLSLPLSSFCLLRFKKKMPIYAKPQNGNTMGLPGPSPSPTP
jgi:hypothetical protein